MTEEKKKFEDLVTLGGYLKKHRRLKGKKIELISKNLFIKKTIIKSFEEGSITLDKFQSDSYLKGFLKSYIKYLELDEYCNLDLIEKKKISNLNQTSLHLETSNLKNTSYGSITILISIILLGLVYLIWNKQTYTQLYILGTSL
ncbi:helix-turn-helix domain-containing protein [Alphaproteobacteria bacterium]|nr:helix-turn-helix domain-containing protein [Alphaproteobacteria bacterium]